MTIEIVSPIHAFYNLIYLSYIMTTDTINYD